jgi:flavin reductase (DIM6/NTAB) family NADH-FMN oxidoreductase RutF
MKVEVGAKNCLYLLPTTLVGELVDGKPNYIAITHVGIMDPGAVSLGMNEAYYTNGGIKKNGTFSVNIPSVKMVKETDYCCLVPGKNVDKAAFFKTFYGKMKTASMIEECAVNMECQLIKTVDFPNHGIFVGKVATTYCDEAVLTVGIVDFGKVMPILFVMNDRSYWNLGTKVAKAWDVGKESIK